ncbi:uncharacterized protein LOC106077540 isoform X2 [Biomphalaria glabrata]|uniref:Uncharacterized protein LOC106077540 isoform X2 n=1 Tax=Biomphalaria glabrata TaxID=6526 RepID=A0A9W2YCB8_BIOGL|nr:uncharacterized protein LOC106077540 isoform X2 [Biomphalaria glabrata]
MRLYTVVRDIVYAVTFFEDVQKDLGKLKDDINIVQKKGEEWVIEDNAPFDEMKKIMQTEKENLMLKIVDILKDIKKKCDICVDEETPKDTNSCNEDSSRITDLSILKMNDYSLSGCG